MNGRADSAGTEPAGRVHPEVVTAMKEMGIDLSKKRPRLLTNTMVRRADRVIIMGCAPDASSCPAILFKHTEDWDLKDPHGQPFERVRGIRDEILRRVNCLVDEIERGGAGDAPTKIQTGQPRL